MYRDENEEKIERLIELKERDRKRLEEVRRIHKDELIAREQKDKAFHQRLDRQAQAGPGPVQGGYCGYCH